MPATSAHVVGAIVGAPIGLAIGFIFGTITAMFPGIIVILILAIIFGEKSPVPDRIIMAWLILCSLAGAVWVGGMGAMGLSGLISKLAGKK